MNYLHEILTILLANRPLVTLFHYSCLVVSITKAHVPEGSQALWQPRNFHTKVQVSSLMSQIPYMPSGDGKKGSFADVR